MATTALVAVCLLGMTACDTVAQLPFGDRNLNRVYTGPLSPAGGGECGAIDRQATLGMILIDNQDGGTPIKYGQEDIESVDSVMPDQNTIAFSSGSLYSLPDVECGDSDAQCRSGLECGPIDRCRITSEVHTNGTLEFRDDNEPDAQAFAVAMSDIGLWDGHYREFQRELSVGSLYGFDPDTNQIIAEIENTPMRTEIAVDRNANRVNALRGATREWGRLNHYVAGDERDAYYGFWTFDDSGATIRSRIAEGRSQGDSPWTSSSDRAIDTANSYREDEDQERSGVYESMIGVLNDAFGHDAVSDVEQGNIVFIVPGHDERRTGPSDADDVIAEAQDISQNTGIDISVSVIQVDTSRELDRIVDDWQYYEGQDERGCESDSECKNFETCREPTWYVENPNDGEDDVLKPEEDDRGVNFCLPTYDENGRLGPIADYDRIACETGGAYHYVPQISESLVETPLLAELWAPEASWEIDLQLEDAQDLLNGDGGAGEAHLLETSMDVNLGRQRTIHFERDDEDDDTRRVFFTPSE